MGGGWRAVGAAIGEDLAHWTDGPSLARIGFRLLVAAVCGGILGYEREVTHKSAGLRTHILVTVAAALYVMLIPTDPSDFGALSRIIQGVVTGIGFLGAGAIIKLTGEAEVRGLTTAAGIWLATAVGLAAGLGRVDIAIIGTVLAFLILSRLGKWEREHR